MKPYRITVTHADGYRHSYTGLFSHSCDAVVHAQILLGNKPGRISARPLERAS